jgi:transposase
MGSSSFPRSGASKKPRAIHESVRAWVRQADIDDGHVGGLTTDESERVKALEQENRELRRANAILKSASAFFAAELDRPQR